MPVELMFVVFKLFKSAGTFKMLYDKIRLIVIEWFLFIVSFLVGNLLCYRSVQVLSWKPLHNFKSLFSYCYYTIHQKLLSSWEDQYLPSHENYHKILEPNFVFLSSRGSIRKFWFSSNFQPVNEFDARTKLWSASTCLFCWWRLTSFCLLALMKFRKSPLAHSICFVAGYPRIWVFVISIHIAASK